MVALVVLGGLTILLAASIFSIIHVEIEIAIVVILVLLLLFTVFSFVLRSKARRFSLEMPSFISEKGLRFIRYATIAFFIVVFAYGMATYPYMPISPNGNIFTDKIGRAYSYSEFLTFRKWGLALVLSWGFVLLQGAMFLPFLDRRVKRHGNAKIKKAA
ncbi:MAG TPA: hypothetical protein VLF17_06450 [Candidatus Nitrosotenuis sp.]|nr:hypothetical protein [Candidatus Nitrosotenuis sp.]